MSFPHVRLRRLRRTPRFRSITRETVLTTDNLAYPVFVKDGISKSEEIASMPGQLRLTIDDLKSEAKQIADLRIPAILIFGIPATKDPSGSSSFNSAGIVQRAIKTIRDAVGSELLVITDVCLCQYTDHGHCGILKGSEVNNDLTLNVLRKIATSHGEAGADMVAPSAMMDGQVRAIREALDEAGLNEVGILAYSAKHASALYSPFRDAAHSSPTFGDRRSYQMDYSNAREALREAQLDINEGADILMVKPALPYLDLIHRIKTTFHCPVAAFNVSGEYAMIKAATALGWLDEKLVVDEILTSIRRAGADLILSYFAKDAAKWMRES